MWMYDARSRDDWQHTATLATLLANCAYALRGVKKDPPAFATFYPFPTPDAPAQAAPQGDLDIDSARELWIRNTNG